MQEILDLKFGFCMKVYPYIQFLRSKSFRPDQNAKNVMFQIFCSLSFRWPVRYHTTDQYVKNKLEYHLGHFVLRVAPKRANRKIPIQIAKPKKNEEQLRKPRKPLEKLRAYTFQTWRVSALVQ